MYNQKIIDSFGEKQLEQLFFNERLLSVDINDNRSEYIRFYFTFQHFLIKAFINGYNRDLCLKYIKKYYNDFSNNPHLFCDSRLLNDKTIDMFFGNSPQNSKIKEFRNNYYNDKILNIIYGKKQNGGLTAEESNKYYARLVLLINKNNKATQDFLSKEIEEIIDTEFSKLTDMQLKFYCEYVSNYAVGDRDLKTVVKIGVTDPTNRGYNSKNYIFINKSAFSSIELLTKTVCHETRHAIQNEESRGLITLSAFEQAQNQLFCKYLNTKEYNSYHRNYQYSGIEIDAELVGHTSASIFFTMFNKQEMATKVRENRRQTTDNRNDYSVMIDSNNKAFNVDEFIVTNMDNIIKNNKEELNNYPVLKKIYNEDGTRKPFTELMSGRMHEKVDNRGIFNNYIKYDISNDKLNDIDLSNLSSDTINNYIGSLSYLYRDIANELNGYFQDDRNKYNEKQVVFATNYKLLLSFKLLKYINDNYDIIMNNTKNIGFYNQNPIYTFIYYLRDFDINSIKNDAIKNNSVTMTNIAKIKELCDTIVFKFNSTYVDDKLNKLSEEILNSKVDIPYLETMSFEEFFREHVVPNMNGHKNVIINNQIYYVGDLINIMANEAVQYNGVGR